MKVKNLNPFILGARSMSGAKSEETDAEFDARYVAYFNRPDIDGWEYRKAMSDLTGMDLVPEPEIINAALRACRRLNDYSLAIRTLEVVKLKCAPNEKELYPYMLQVRFHSFEVQLSMILPLLFYVLING